MILFNQKDPIHQYFMVSLTLMYYAAGDPKDVYDMDDLDWFMEVFDLKDENEIAKWLSLECHKEIYEDWSKLKVMNNSNHQQQSKKP